MRWKFLPRARNVEISMVAACLKSETTQLEESSSQKWEKGIRIVFQFKIFRLFSQFPHTGRTYVRKPTKFSEYFDNFSCKIHANYCLTILTTSSCNFHAKILTWFLQGLVKRIFWQFKIKKNALASFMPRWNPQAKHLHDHKSVSNNFNSKYHGELSELL